MIRIKNSLVAFLVALVMVIMLTGCHHNFYKYYPCESYAGFIYRTYEDFFNQPAVKISTSSRAPQGYIPFKGAEIVVNDGHLNKSYSDRNGYFSFYGLSSGYKVLYIYHYLLEIPVQYVINI